jgi:pimeloyl-ACP methyl ester carboxylesterase
MIGARPIWSGPASSIADGLTAGDPPVVVLLHSSGASSRQWDALVAGLRTDYAVHAVDLHGHGRQPGWRGDAPLSLDDEAALVLPWLERAGGAHLIGHSYGAAVALQVAAAWPSLVRRVAVFEPVLFGLLAVHDPHSQGAREAFELGALLASMVDDQPALAAERFVDYWSGPSAWKRLPPPAQQAVIARMPAVVPHFDALFREAWAPTQLARLNMPMLFLAGDRSTAAALRIALLLRTLLPAATHELLPGVGHLAPMTHPTAVNERLLRFLGARPSVHPIPTRPAIRPDISTNLPMEQSA